MVWSSAAPQHEISMSQVWHTDATVPAEPLNRGDACVRVCVCARACEWGAEREREREQKREGKVHLSFCTSAEICVFGCVHLCICDVQVFVCVRA